MSEKKIGEYSYVTPETEAEKKLQEKKYPKDRLLAVERLQKYEVTLQDMFAMRQHYNQEGINALKNAVLSLRDYKSAMVQVKTWEEQILKAMADIPELKDNNEIPQEDLVTEEVVKLFDETCAELETYHNDIALKDVPPDVVNEHLEETNGLSLAKTKLEEPAFWLNKAITKNDN